MATTTSSSVKDKIQKAEQKVEHALTILWNDLPTWMQDNHYILSGYRSPSNSYAQSLASITSHIHNESVNIWTHLLGALGALLAAFYTLRPMAAWQDIAVFSCFFGGAALCLGMSATYHTLSNHSEAVQKLGNRLDYFGIVVLIWGSFVPSIYYGFAPQPELVTFYWGMITTIGAGTLLVILHPQFRSSQWRPFRAFMFTLMGLSAIIPIVHGVRVYGWEQMELQMGLSWVVLQGGLYVLGAVLYAVRVPERLSPGRFDLWGSSHQIFHCLVVAAAGAHLVGLVRAFDYHVGGRGGL